MRFLDNTKIGPKLIGGFMLVAALLVGMGFAGSSKVHAIDEADTRLYEKMTVPLSEVATTMEAFQQQRVFLRDAIMTGDAEKYGAKIKELDVHVAKVEESFLKTLLTEDGKESFRKYKDASARYDRMSDKVLEMVSLGKGKEAESFLRLEGAKLNDEVTADLDALQAMKIKLAKQTSDDNTVLADGASRQIYIFMGIAVLFAIVMGWILTQSITNPLKQGVEMMKEMAKGHLGTRLKMERTDEIGDLARAMDGFTDNLQTIVGGLTQISNGDLSREWVATDAQDEINPALKQARTNLQALVADMAMLNQAAVEGKLATRVDATKHQGDYRKIVQGVNDCLDAVIGPLNVAAGYVDRISKGDIPPKITDKYNGDFNEIKNNLNQCVDAVNALVADAGMLNKAAVEGKLATRADATKHQGDFRKVVQGVNDCLDAVIGPLNVSAGYVDRISKGDIPPKITDKYNGDFNEIKNNLNQCVDAVNALVADAGMLNKAAVEGKLATRADATKHQGDFRKVVQGVNDCLDAVIGPLNVSAGYVDRISKGDIPPKITDKYNGDFNEIKNNLNQCIDAVNSLVADAGILRTAAVEGKLATRADATKHQGDYRKVVQGVNDCLDALIVPLNVTATYVDQISKGVIPPIITDNYNGDFNLIKNNLNNMVKMMSDLLAQTDIIIQGAADGQLDKRANADLFVGGWNQLVKGVNEAVTNIVNPMNVTADYVDKVAKGIIPPTITTEYKGQYNVIKNNLNNMVKMMSDLLAQTDIIIQGAADGQLDKRANADMFVGGWNQLVKGVNQAITNIVDPMNVTADYVDKVAKGIIPPVITTEYKGQYNVIKNNLNNMVGMMSELLSETDTLVKAAIGGQLATRATTTKFVGGWFQLVDGVNKTLDAVIAPLNVTASYVDRIGKGEVPQKITDHYNGDFNIIKGSINSCIDGLQGLVEANNVIQRMAANDFTMRVEGKYMGIFEELGTALNETIVQMREALVQVQEGAVAIASASGEIAMGNQDLSSRTEEQAANLEETASGLEQITSNVNLTADNAQSANQEAVKARQVAQDGGTAVTQVIAAMESINESSAKINEIIGVVDEIAFQTNLLALNAAVEAARAGEQGRGFAVVAAEVRNLAKRSADAAKEIKVLIRESVAKSVDGSKVAAHAGETIQEVVANVQRVTALVGEIANATQEQSTGLIELNKAVVQMDEVTQQNAALVEEAAAAAETLDGQAHNLAEVVSRFKTGTESRRTETTRAAAHPGAARRTQQSQRKAAACEPAPKSPARAAAPVPRMSTAKRPVPTPVNGDDGQWESF